MMKRWRSRWDVRGEIGKEHDERWGAEEML